MKIISRYDGQCRTCGEAITKGDQIEWSRRGGARHPSCCRPGPNRSRYSGDYDPELAAARRERRRDDMDYAMGQADAGRYLDMVRLLGEETANEMELENEIRRGWDY